MFLCPLLSIVSPIIVHAYESFTQDKEYSVVVFRVDSLKLLSPTVVYYALIDVLQGVLRQ